MTVTSEQKIRAVINVIAYQYYGLVWDAVQIDDALRQLEYLRSCGFPPTEETLRLAVKKKILRDAIK